MILPKCKSRLWLVYFWDPLLHPLSLVMTFCLKDAKKGSRKPRWSQEDVFWLPKSTISRSLSPLLLEISILIASFCHWECGKKNHFATFVLSPKGMWEFSISFAVLQSRPNHLPILFIFCMSGLNLVVVVSRQNVRKAFILILYLVVGLLEFSYILFLFWPFRSTSSSSFKLFSAKQTHSQDFWEKHGEIGEKRGLKFEVAGKAL